MNISLPVFQIKGGKLRHNFLKDVKIEKKKQFINNVARYACLSLIHNCIIVVVTFYIFFDSHLYHFALLALLASLALLCIFSITVFKGNSKCMNLKYLVENSQLLECSKYAL